MNKLVLIDKYKFKLATLKDIEFLEAGTIKSKIFIKELISEDPFYYELIKVENNKKIKTFIVCNGNDSSNGYIAVQGQ